MFFGKIESNGSLCGVSQILALNETKITQGFNKYLCSRTEQFPGTYKETEKALC